MGIVNTPGKAFQVRGVGAALERVVLYNSIPLFKEEGVKIGIQPKQSYYSIPRDDKNKTSSSFMSRLCCDKPSEDFLPFEYCRYSSVHGLPYIPRSTLHLSERIFWTIAFILGVVAAVFLIKDVWQRFYLNPVIVTFQAQEVDIDTIPFPSVTICSMNAFPKSEVQRLQILARASDSADAREAREALKYVREVCHSQISFSKAFHFSFRRGKDDESDLGQNDTIINTEESQSEMREFLLKHTLPCEDLIRLCRFAEESVECGKIFEPLITDYGKCCTFNMLPPPLLLTSFKRVSSISDSNLNYVVESNSPNYGTSRRWPQEELDLWSAWDYDKVGFILSKQSFSRPFRQKRAGLPYGLSILVDPNIDDWYCPVSDSEGFRFLLHKPLEMPLVDEFASVIQLDQEITIEIHPEMTNADDDIRNIDRKARNCYFPEEYQLKFFGPYTAGNCLTECASMHFGRTCNCTYFYMPHEDHVGICNSEPSSNDYKCIANAKDDLMKTLKTRCGHCDSLCEDIDYNFETTTAKLQDRMELWGDPDPEHIKGSAPSWATNKMSVVHIFLGSETVVPKLRKRMYGTTDLIASTGGLLGLCLGFSVLSAMEVVYFLTLRAFWSICWKKRMKRNRQQPIKLLKLHHDPEQNFNRGTAGERIITLNPNHIPILRQSDHYAWQNYSNKAVPTHMSARVMNKKGL